MLLFLSLLRYILSKAILLCKLAQILAYLRVALLEFIVLVVVKSGGGGTRFLGLKVDMILTSW